MVKVEQGSYKLYFVVCLSVQNGEVSNGVFIGRARFEENRRVVGIVLPGTIGRVLAIVVAIE